MTWLTVDDEDAPGTSQLGTDRETGHPGTDHHGVDDPGRGHGGSGRQQPAQTLDEGVAAHEPMASAHGGDCKRCQCDDGRAAEPHLRSGLRRQEPGKAGSRVSLADDAADDQEREGDHRTEHRDQADTPAIVRHGAGPRRPGIGPE